MNVFAETGDNQQLHENLKQARGVRFDGCLSPNSRCFPWLLNQAECLWLERCYLTLRVVSVFCKTTNWMIGARESASPSSADGWETHPAACGWRPSPPPRSTGTGRGRTWWSASRPRRRAPTPSVPSGQPAAPSWLPWQRQDPPPLRRHRLPPPPRRPVGMRPCRCSPRLCAPLPASLSRLSRDPRRSKDPEAAGGHEDRWETGKSKPYVTSKNLLFEF